MYSIKAVSQATGLSVETLRAWERRYGLVAPQRDSSGRRVYGAGDVLRLRRLREATDRGHPIGRLANLSEDELARLLDATPGQRPDAAAAALIERVLEAAQRFRADECEQALTLAIASLPPQTLVADVLGPLLHEVGERWHRGEFSICQERLVSSAIRRHVSIVLDAYDRCARRAGIVFATLPGERHELGLLMSAMMCASRGFRAHYLGPDLPAQEIALFARKAGAGIVALSVVLRESVTELPGQLREIVAGMEPGASVWVGGSAAAGLTGPLPDGCHVVRDRFELERRLDMLAA